MNEETGSARRMSWQPAAALTPYVRAMTAYDYALDAPGTHRGLPSTSLTVVLPVAEPIDVGWHGHESTRVRQWSCVSGLHTSPAEIRHDGRQAGIMLALTPRGARTLFGLPASELVGALTQLDDVAPKLADLPERLAAATTWRERLLLVETRLCGALAQRPEVTPRPAVAWALRRLSGPAPVAAVSGEVGLSRRHLGQLFRAEYGLTPKQYQRIARFEAAHHGLARQVALGQPALAGIAAQCGYADQAHLTREWTALAGYTPTAWLRAELPFLQDTTTAAS